jgi:lysophospholipase L1-like esterase
MTVVAALGDSITAGTPRWDPDPEVRRAIGDAVDERHQWPWWAERAHPGLEFRNHGVNFERTDQIAARFEIAVEGADVLIVQGGINDVVQGREPEAAAANLHELVRRGKELGLGVGVTDVLPWNNGYPENDAQIRRLNALIAALADEEGVPLLPFFATLEDPERPGRMRADWTDDGNHPSLAGHRRLGELAFRLPPTAAASRTTA